MPDQPLSQDPQSIDDFSINESGNRPFADIAAKHLSRRQVLSGGLGMASLMLFGGAASSLLGNNAFAATSGKLGFSAVPVSQADTVVVPEGYSAQVMIPWGEPITGHFPAFSPANSADEQAMQIGTHHDGMHYFPIEGIHPWQGSSVDGLLVLNHEYMEPRLMHESARGQEIPAVGAPANADGSRDSEQIRKEMNAHGVSIVRIALDADGQWQVQRDPRNRRITGLTDMEFSGPLRGHAHMRTRFSPDGTRTRGTINNCSHGVTPWNTYLTCEENWWFYFHVDDRATMPASLLRYRVGASDPWRWHADAQARDEAIRFNLTPSAGTAEQDYRNEAHGFGYIVEIDPFDPQSTPIKRTHLGRFAHEGIVFAPAREGHPIVCYSGDDSAGEYIFKFVSRAPYHAATASGALLDNGTLYAARFAEDGSGEWLALVPGEHDLGDKNGFGTLQDILLNTRGAADIAGATPMDRPEWGAVDPGNGHVYFTLTNNASRTADQTDAANPRGPNYFGQIVRWREANDDHTSTRFAWALFVMAGPSHNSRDLNGNPLGEDNIFVSPDGLWFDADRRLWIQTDIAEGSTLRPPYAEFGNNAMLAADPDTGEIRRFMTGPIGQEITGCVSTPDQSTLFINVQHPGGSMTSAQQFAAGEFVSRWPDGGDSIPRSATLAIRRHDGGKVGGY